MKFEHGTQVRDYINWEYLVYNGMKISNYAFSMMSESTQEDLLRTYVVGIDDEGNTLILENK